MNQNARVHFGWFPIREKEITSFPQPFRIKQIEGCLAIQIVYNGTHIFQYRKYFKVYNHIIVGFAT